MDCIGLDDLSPVGFGCYRVKAGVAEHYAALMHALTLGCTLIDTASNYCDGLSEELVGEVLSNAPHFPAFVVTKVGYVTHSAEELLRTAGVTSEQLYPISGDSKYSMSPDILKIQLTVSLRRLRRARLDALLLHNPEHYFDCEGIEKTLQGYYDRVRGAFEFFEQCVAEGKLRYYGVSSNTLAFSKAHESKTNLDCLLDAARAVSSSHHFRLIEFPFNFAETKALDKQANGRSLIDDIRANGLVSIANRPLNSLRGNQTLRFATYEDERRELDPIEAGAAYERCVELIRDQLASAHLPYDVMDFAVMQFLRDNWHGVEHPDTVDQIFGRHFYPFVDRLWDGSVPDEVRSACAALHRYAKLYARQQLSEMGQYVRAELIQAGVIADDDTRPLAAIACDFPLQSGIDHVVVGMRAVRYVESLRDRIPTRARHLKRQTKPITG